MKSNYDLIQIKIQLLEKFYKNCKEQINILEKKLFNELEDVLKEQDNIIEELKTINKEISLNSIADKTKEDYIQKKLNDIKMMQDIIINKVNNSKNNLSKKFKQINVGKKAIYGGYIKAEPMNNGCFIDKKIGR